VPLKIDRKRAKTDALSKEGTLNPTPDKVNDPKFLDGEFFDPRDAVQVKYELLRRVLVDKASVTDAAEAYGISRPTYYQAKADFEQAGIAGLAPKKRGPHGPHKIQGEVMAFLEQQLIAGEPIRARQLAALIRSKFGIVIHPRTIERAVPEKKLPNDVGAAAQNSLQLSIVASQYETLRKAALGEALPPEARSGLALFLRLGMLGWARTLVAARAVQQPICASTPRPTAPQEHSQFIHILAAMTMNVNERRAP
jgi:transposase